MAHADLVPEAKTATILREPLERLRSAIRHTRTLDPTTALPVMFRMYSANEMLADERFHETLTTVANETTRMFSQMDFDGPRAPLNYEAMLEAAMKSLDRLDFVGIFEDFPATTRRLYELVNLPVEAAETPLFANQSDGPPDNFDDEAFAIAQHLCRYDIAIYREFLSRYVSRYGGYRFDLVSPSDAVGTRNGHKVVESRAEDEGILAFGPYARLPAGRYVARFCLRATGPSQRDNSDGSAQINLDVSDGFGTNIIAKRDWLMSDGEIPDFQTLELPFVLSRPTSTAEFRISTTTRVAATAEASVEVVPQLG